MESMTVEQREKFIRQRVKEILDAYEAVHKTIDAMGLDERDEYVHSRVERDLAVSEAIEKRQEAYVASSANIGREVLMMDVIALLILAWMAVHDLRDVIGFAAVVAAMGISRYLDYIRDGKARDILELDRARISREIDTATLGFLINAVRKDAEKGGAQ